MISNGSLINNIERYKHVVTRSVSGSIKESIIDCHLVNNLLPKDIIIIYSDGVSDILNSYQINNVFKSAASVQEGVSEVEILCNIEAKDNFSMIAILV